MEKIVRKKIKTRQEWEIILNERFSYLPAEEREKLIRGNELVKVPSEELKRLRIDAYPCLM